MDLQVLYRGSNDSVFPKTHKTKKAIKQNKSNSYKNNEFPSKGNYVKNIQHKPHADCYDRYVPHAYPSWNVFNEGHPSKRNGVQGFSKFEDHYNRPNNYAKTNFQLSYNKEFFYDKVASRSTGPSDNENGGTEIFSELTGFRIVQNGRTIHDETNEDFDSNSSSDSEELQKEDAKFASSELTIGPNAGDISIPSFADE